MRNRKSIRLKGYDYASQGEYFVTICTKNKACLFGKIFDGKMVLNDCGLLINKWWHKIPKKYHHVINIEYIIMPNHVHGIIEINKSGGHLGPEIQTGGHLGPEIQTGGHLGPPLHVVIQWFKTMTTNEYIRNVKTNKWIPFDGRLWQRNYYEHIIRDETAYENIKNYIRDNPINWMSDKLNK